MDENAENRAVLHEICISASPMPPKAILSSQWNRPPPDARHPTPRYTQRCHVRVSHSNFRLEPDARNFANSDHAYITARLTKKILSAFFPCIFFLPFSPPLFLSLSLFFFFFLVFELSLRTPDNAKILLKQSPTETCAGENLDADDLASSLSNFLISNSRSQRGSSSR